MSDKPKEQSPWDFLGKGMSESEKEISALKEDRDQWKQRHGIQEQAFIAAMQKLEIAKEALDQIIKYKHGGDYYKDIAIEALEKLE